MISPRSVPTWSPPPRLERYIASKLPPGVRKWVVYLAALEALRDRPQTMGSVTAGEMLDAL